jgi:hypothetical protein
MVTFRVRQRNRLVRLQMRQRGHCIIKRPCVAHVLKCRHLIESSFAKLMVVGRWGNRQHSADRLDPMRLAVIVNERDHGLNRRSSSPCAKYALALHNISLAWCSSRTSRPRDLILSRSALVEPGRRPRSRSACRTQCRSVSPVQPIFAAIEVIAAVPTGDRPCAPVPSALRARAPQVKICCSSCSS